MKKYLRLIGIIILVIILLKIDLETLVSTLSKINIPCVICVILLNIPHIFIKSLRWKRLLQRQSIRYTLKDSFLVYLSSIYAGHVTPGRLGEFVKALYLKSDKGISLSRGMSSVLLDRLCDMYLLIILGIVGIWKFGICEKFSGVFLILAIVVAMSPIIVLSKTVMNRILSFFYNFTLSKKVENNLKEKSQDFYAGINQLLNAELIFAGFLTCLSYLIFFTQCYLLAIAMKISISFMTITLVMAISNLVSFIPITVSGLGTRDAILIYLFSLVYLSPELAVSFAFAVFFFFFVCGGISGAIAWYIRPVPVRSFLK